tara:strand:- start:373 stop:1284 length:912 start_codon:yes stop_codon:yes gene_type:complete
MIKILLIIIINVLLLYIIFSRNKEKFTNINQNIVIKEPYDSFYAPVYSSLISDQVMDKSKFETNDLIKVSSLKHYPNASLIDIGSGGGDHIIWLKKRKLPNLKLTAIDSSEYMLKETRKRFNKFKVEVDNVRFINKDIHESDLFMPTSFSHITCFYFTIYQLKLKETLKNIYKWLRPGGWFVVHVVDMDRFDPILDAASPFYGTTLQKYSKNRITESKVHFKKFTYYSNFSFKKSKKGDKKAVFDEMFDFKNKPIIRKQRHYLNVFKIDEFVDRMAKLKFELKHTTNLSHINYPFQYLLYFQK